MFNCWKLNRPKGGQAWYHQYLLYLDMYKSLNIPLFTKYDKYIASKINHAD